ncbi:class I SAM-dependent methyltransferase [Paraburkholderia sp. J12]|uniref:class I SAM-dependent methyltransferase n=1 Tax=Paraburkholderia sp. J12 TaxID=2805432 RepID=UPI002ABE9FF7|nr:methyltransferase domain-containing protein [Paraburkholderia sp. J12]
MDTIDFVTRYDRMILDANTRQLYGGGDFYNVGEWPAETGTLDATGQAAPDRLPRACAALVQRVIAPALAQRVCQAGDRLLDVGCGLGASSAELARQLPGTEVIGVNLSQAQLTHARTRYPALAFCAMDATHLGFADESVRCIVSIEAAFHFQPRTAFLREAWRVLQPGGMLLMSDMLFAPSGATPWWVPDANRTHREAHYLQDCLAAGFAVEQCDDTTATTLHPFCHHLEQAYPGSGLADSLREAVAAYLVVALRKTAGCIRGGLPG